MTTPTKRLKRLINTASRWQPGMVEGLKTVQDKCTATACCTPRPGRTKSLPKGHAVWAGVNVWQEVPAQEGADPVHDQRHVQADPDSGDPWQEGGNGGASGGKEVDKERITVPGHHPQRRRVQRQWDGRSGGTLQRKHRQVLPEGGAGTQEGQEAGQGERAKAITAVPEAWRQAHLEKHHNPQASLEPICCGNAGDCGPVGGRVSSQNQGGWSVPADQRKPRHGFSDR